MDNFWHFYLTFVSLAMLNDIFSVIFKHRGCLSLIHIECIEMYFALLYRFVGKYSCKEDDEMRAKSEGHNAEEAIAMVHFEPTRRSRTLR